MDWYRPPGGIDALFRQYDHIRSHGARQPAQAQLQPAPIAPNPPENPSPADEPPWSSPEDHKDANGVNEDVPSPDAVRGDSGSLGGLIGGAVAAAGTLGKQTAQNSLRAALPELAEPLLGAEGLGASEAAALAPEALGLAELAPGLALGLAGIAAVDKAERSIYREAPTRQGDYGFEVDGKNVPMKPGFYEKAPLTAAAAPTWGLSIV